MKQNFNTASNLWWSFNVKGCFLLLKMITIYLLKKQLNPIAVFFYVTMFGKGNKLKCI